MSTRRVVETLVILVLAVAAGWWMRGRLGPPGEPGLGRGTAPPAHDGPCPGGAQALYWKAPMDPTFVRDAPGKSPMGMDLVPACPSSGEQGAGGKSGIVRVDSAVVQTIGVRTATAQRRDLSREVRAVGRVTWDERRVAHVHTKVQGWVEKLHVDFKGQEVERGQPLLEIYSPELVATQEELLLADRYRKTTAESPFEEISRGGQSLFEATRRRLQLWDIADRDVRALLETGEVKRTLTLHAPSAGVVTNLAVRTGMEVSPNSNLYTIADLSAVWVIANVYEFELPWVELGQTGRVRLASLPGEEFRGPVTWIAPFLDPKTRTAQVRLELPNPKGRLKPEMFGNTVIEASPVANAIAVPTEAVIHSGRRTLVIVALGEGRFEPRPVELGVDSGDGFTELRSGVEPGEQVVVSSQFLIDSESKLQEAIRKLLSSSEDAPAHREEH